MAAPGVAASGTGTGTPAGGGGMNPFWEVTNLFSQKNKIGQVAAQQITTGVGQSFMAGQINFGNYFRGLRIQVRQTVAPVGAYTPPTGGADLGFQLIQAMGIQNTDGAEILFDVIGGFAYQQRNKYFRPWLKDWSTAYDYLNNGSAQAATFTAFLNPEVRQQLGALENTDTRSQYTFSATIGGYGTAFGQIGTWATSGPTYQILPYTDMWAQPDNADLEGVSNQRIPPGVNFQTKTRHQIFVLNTNGSDNNFLSTLTGNALRGQLFIARDGTGTRQDGFTEPLTWTLDNRNLGNLSQDQIWRWADDFLNSYNLSARATGVYPLLRFYDPGRMVGQGWLYTANSTALNLETTSGSGAPSATGGTSTTGPGIASVGTAELVQEEVYAVGAIDPSLIDI